MSETNEEQELFSDDPEEQLRMENEILKLKLMAELGGDYQEMEDMPADVENMFLKNVLEFEHQHASTPSKKLVDILGQPAFPPSSELNDEQVSEALAKLEEIMSGKNIVVDYGAVYPHRLKYEFITEELFQTEASMFAMPGMTMHYIYEEFHPNHELTIRGQVERFMRDWFNRSFNEYSFEIAKHLFVADQAGVTRQAFLEKVQLVFDSYPSFDNEQSYIENISFTLLENDGGRGFAEGRVSYDATMENGDTVSYNGPFKFDLERDGDCWFICALKWPGFSW